MTYRVIFFAENVFLSHAKSVIDNCNEDDSPAVYAMSILACAAAIEATCNNLLLNKINIIDYDNLNINEKINKIIAFGGTKADWSRDPWQSIARLIKTRNWLLHFKEHNIGLVNSNFKWLDDELNKIPGIDPFKELTHLQISKYYNISREALIILFQSAGVDDNQFEYLHSEKYEPFFLIG